jgi:hypothetical protein
MMFFQIPYLTWRLLRRVAPPVPKSEGSGIFCEVQDDRH